MVNAAFSYCGGIRSPVNLHPILGRRAMATLLLAWGEGHRKQGALFSPMGAESEGCLLAATN